MSDLEFMQTVQDQFRFEDDCHDYRQQQAFLAQLREQQNQPKEATSEQA